MRVHLSSSSSFSFVGTTTTTGAAAAVLLFILCNITAVLLSWNNNNDGRHFYVVEAFSTNTTPQRVFISTPTPTNTNPRLVQDCMTRNPITLRTTDTVDDAIATLLATGFNGAPVIDPITKNLVGVISAFDFLSKEEAGSILPLYTDDPEERHEMAKCARKIVATTVGDLMTEAGLTVQMDMTMKEAAELMIRDRCHRLCVVDDEYNLVGILSTSDVMKNVMTQVLRALPEHKSAAATAAAAVASGDGEATDVTATDDV